MVAGADARGEREGRTSWLSLCLLACAAGETTRDRTSLSFDQKAVGKLG